MARLVLTAPQPRAQALAAALREHGHESLSLSFAAIESLAGAPEQAAVLARLGQFEQVIFVSPGAIDVICDALDAMGQGWPASAAPAIVGPGSREALAGRGLDEHPGLLMPAGPVFDAAHLLALPKMAAPRGRRILVVRGEGGNTFIEDELARRGALVDSVAAYRRQALRPDAASLRLLAGWLRQQPLPRLVVTTVDAAERLAALDGSVAHDVGMRQCPALAIHRRIAGRLVELGWSEVRLVEPGLAALRAAIESARDGPDAPLYRRGTECD